MKCQVKAAAVARPLVRGFMFPRPGAGLCLPFATAVALEANLSSSVLVFVFPVSLVFFFGTLSA